jgi:26S proteasome regulatory subunit N8
MENKASKEVIPFETVVVHPLVLLSVVDHFNRMKQVGNTRRVVGLLLGSLRNKTLDISNSFAVPFDEDDKDKDVWFFDHEYAENMYAMFKKVNGKSFAIFAVVSLVKML